MKNDHFLVKNCEKMVKICYFSLFCDTFDKKTIFNIKEKINKNKYFSEKMSQMYQNRIKTMLIIERCDSNQLIEVRI